MIRAQNLTRRYGRSLAVNNVSFTVERGEVVGFLGPNGAGKTTVLRMLSGFLPATCGEANVAGFDILTQSLEVRRRIGYLPENVPLYNDMRVEEYVRYRGQLKGVRGKKLRTRTATVLEQCGIADARRKIIGTLSKGYRQRLGLADSLIHEPPILLLDEPTIGLDPRQIRHIRDLIRNLSEQHTVLISSHVLPEVEKMCQRVLILHQGRIVASDTPANLSAHMTDGRRVVAEIQGDTEKIGAALGQIPGVARVACEAHGDWNRFVCHCRPNADIRPPLFELVSRNSWALRELAVEQKKLEDVFVALTQEQADPTHDAL